MYFSLIKTLGYFIGGLWTAWGGRKRIETKQLSRLRRLVKKARQDSPLFKELYKNLPESDCIELHDLPATFKIDLMKDFDCWLTIRTLTLAQAQAHMADMKNLGVPIEGEEFSGRAEKGRKNVPHRLKVYMTNSEGVVKLLYRQG